MRFFPMTPSTPQHVTQYAGLDYGLGRTNIDKATEIRYGVISQHSVNETWFESAEPEYGEPHCPKCGEPVLDPSDASIADADWNDGKDWACPSCQLCHWSEDCYPDEALGYSYERDGYQLTDCLDSDIFVLKSPYFTWAQFCSPCVPGAGNLDSPTEQGNGARCYCLGHDWFDGEVAPYPVYRVSDGLEVLAEARQGETS